MRMKLLIVDDEIHKLRLLRAGIDWKQLGIDRVFTAYHAKGAREILREEEIDILICDVEMPETTGIELLSWIRSEKYAVETILLTDGVTYDCARMAVKLDAFAYLLKPVDTVELEEELRTLIGKIKLRKQEEENKAYGYYWIENQLLVKELFWKNVCLERIPNQPEEIEKKARSVNVSMDKDSRYKLVLITIRNLEELFQTWGEDLCQAAIQNLAQGVVKDNSDISQVIVLEYSKDDVLGQNTIIRVEHQKNKAAKEEILLPTQWSELLYAGHINMLITKVRHFLTGLARSDNLNEMNFRIFQQDMLQMFFTYMEKKELMAHELYENHEIYKSYKTAILSIDGMCHWIQKCVDFILKQTGHSTPTGSEHLVRLVKQHITTDLRTEISREEIAARLNMNPDYINRVFKRETGMTMKEYSIHKRIQEAQTLLRTTSLTVSEVALSVGYDNFSYFIKLFKKQIGQTPGQYKKVE